MQTVIQNEVREKFSPCLGVVYATGIDNTKEVTEIEDLFKDASVLLKDTFNQYENVGQHPTILSWRNVYKAFGTDPKRYRLSIEALARRVLKDEPLPRINTLVDLYNYISIKHVLPVGGENSDAIQGDLQLAIADGSEEFIVLNGSESESPESNEVVYKDDQGIICRRWNWREADRTKLTKEITNAVIVIDTVPPIERATVESAAQELAELIHKYCGGEVRTEILT